MQQAQTKNLPPPLRRPSVPDWPVLRLLNRYRLIVVLALAVIYYFVAQQQTLGQRSALFFEAALITYCVVIIVFIGLEYTRRISAATLFYVQNYLDILCLVAMMFASGGVQSGLGLLLLINIALLSQLTTTRHALLFAAIATSVVLAGEFSASTMLGPWAADFERTAFLGMMLFVVAWLITVPLRRLVDREITRATKNRAALDANEIAMLNEEIIRELSLEEQRRNRSTAVHAFTISATGQDVLPRFTPLSTGGVLIRIDDHSDIRQQFQQLKLASLGRLSASIAHEIRNPLSAVSHAMQLLQESEHIDTIDAQLLSIAHNNTHRINRIIEDILQLSNRQQIRRNVLDLKGILDSFETRFKDECLADGSVIRVEMSDSIPAVFDPDHLDQVLWNLCSNAILHNSGQAIELSVIAYRAAPNVTIIDIKDNGRGIADLEREKLFEPFYSTHHDGCGLGLYIIRELCELNNADITCMESESGAHFRLTLSNTQQMAA